MRDEFDRAVHQRITATYAAEAADYRNLWAPALNRVALELLKELPPAPRVLDVATGVGTLLPCIRRLLGARFVVGFDLVHEMISLADTSFPRVVGDAARLPFADSLFDTTVLAFVLFHLPRPQEALMEAHRVLRPGATVGTITWESEGSSAAGEAWTEELDRSEAPDPPKRSWHELVDSPEKVAGLLEETGFQDVRTWTLTQRDEPAPDEFVQRRLRLGASGRRLRALDPRDREACVAAAIKRVGRMEREAFTAEWRFVLATAHAATPDAQGTPG